MDIKDLAKHKAKKQLSAEEGVPEEATFQDNDHDSKLADAMDQLIAQHRANVGVPEEARLTPNYDEGDEDILHENVNYKGNQEGKYPEKMPMPMRRMAARNPSRR